MRKSLFLFLLLFNLLVSAQTSSDYASLSTKEALIAIKQKYKLPSLCLAVVRENSVVFQIETGVREDQSVIAVNDQMLYQIGSLTKGMVSYVAASLVESGCITWDTPLLQMVPELKGTIHEAYTKVTLADLLSHRAGVTTYFDAKDLNELTTFEHGKDLLAFALMELKKAPTITTGFDYSNGGYAVVALMLEKATGKNWKQLLNTYITERHGVTFYHGWPCDSNPMYPLGHTLNGDTLKQGRPFEFAAAIEPSGHISMSLENLIKWSRVHLAILSGSDTTLSKRNRDCMYYGRKEYAMGWYNFEIGGVKFLSHTGIVDSFFASMGINVDKNQALLFLVNAYGPAVESAANEIYMLIHERTMSNRL